MILYRSKKFFTIVLLFFVIGLFFAVYIFYTTPKMPYVSIAGTKIPVILADNDQSRIQGLSDRPSLERKTGMLFIFPDKAHKIFWMKRMHFPLDIIWIEDNRIIKIDTNLAPEGENPQKKYQSGGEVNYVLEVNAGFSDKKSFRVGDIVNYYLH